MLSLSLSTTPFSSSSSQPSSSDQWLDYHDSRPSTAPIPIGAHLEENGMSRSASSSLSSSLESISSVRSSYSSRSALEREQERRERRRLLDLSIEKIQGAAVPLRKHLLVYNAAKVLQKDLDALDEEDLYATLMEPLHSTMEVVDNWAVFSEDSLKREVVTRSPSPASAAAAIPAAAAAVGEERMEVEESAASANIWQWMDSSAQLHDKLSQHQESWSRCSSVSSYESASTTTTSSSGASSSLPTWSFFSGMESLLSSPLDDFSCLSSHRVDSSPSSSPPSSSSYSSFSFFESDAYTCGDFSRVWNELTPLSSRDFLHLLPIEA